MFGEYFLEDYIKRLNERTEVIKDSITSGAIASMEDYRASVSKIFAYQDALNLLREVYSHFYETKTIYSRRDENGDEQPED